MDINVYLKDLGRKTKDIGLRVAFVAVLFVAGSEFISMKAKIEKLEKEVKELKAEE